MTRQYFAEFIGTFVLVFAGTTAIVVNDISGGMITHPGVAVVFGLVVAAMIYTLGDISERAYQSCSDTGVLVCKAFSGQ